MQLSFFGYSILAIVLGAFIAGVTCGIVAYRRKKLFISDFGTILLPAVTFYIVGWLRPEFRIGWGLLIGPLITLVLSAYAFVFRVAVIDDWVGNARVSSRMVFAICVIMALSFAAAMAPWYE